MKLNNKINRLLLLIICVSMVSSVCVFASPSSPVSEYGVSLTNGNIFNLFKDTAYAYVRRCSCLPVDNELSTNLQVQYYDKSTGTYIWIPGPESSRYYLSRGFNTEMEELEISNVDIVYAHSIHDCRCGSGNIIRYEDSATSTV